MNNSYVLDTVNGDVRDIKIRINLKLPYDANDAYCIDPFKMTLKQLIKLSEQQDKEEGDDRNSSNKTASILSWGDDYK